MDARTSKRQKRISRRQEASMAEDLGGRVQPASGAMANAKGDVRKMGVVRAEAKYTAKDSYVLKLADLDKIINEAGLERAVFQVCFIDRANRPIIELAIFPWKRGIIPYKANLQSFGKSILLDRDRIAVKLLKEDYHIVFSDHHGDKEPRWFRILEWKRYLTLMEELDA